LAAFISFVASARLRGEPEPKHYLSTGDASSLRAALLASVHPASPPAAVAVPAAAAAEPALPASSTNIPVVAEAAGVTPVAVKDAVTPAPGGGPPPKIETRAVVKAAASEAAKTANVDSPPSVAAAVSGIKKAPINAVVAAQNAGIVPHIEAPQYADQSEHSSRPRFAAAKAAASQRLRATSKHGQGLGAGDGSPWWLNPPPWWLPPPPEWGSPPPSVYSPFYSPYSSPQPFHMAPATNAYPAYSPHPLPY
jgi:hypothetical protein